MIKKGIRKKRTIVAEKDVPKIKRKKFSARCTVYKFFYKIFSKGSKGYSKTD